jgi:hypothetical protein
MGFVDRLYSGGSLGIRLALASSLYLIAVHAGLDDTTKDQSSFLPHAVALLLLGVAAPFVAAEARPASIRLAALRAVVAALLLGLVDLLVLHFCNSQIAIGYREWRLGTFLVGFGTGSLVAPLLVVEWLAARKPPGLGRAVEAAFAAFGGAFLGLGLVALEFAYVHSLVQDGSVTGALNAVSEFFPRVIESPMSCAFRIFPHAIPFALLVFARQRRLGVVAQMDLVVWGTTLLMVVWAILKVGVVSEQLDYATITFVFFPVRRGPLLLTAAVLPIACQLADRLDIALAGRLVNQLP